MKVLAIDTSSESLNIGIVEDKQILASLTVTGLKNHSVTLLPNVNELCKKVKIAPKELDRIIVTQGPGSYTGLRIGVTFAKTLAWTLKKELVGVSSLEALAANVKEEGFIAPVLDARRKNVYTGLYQRKGTELISVIKDQHISFEKWLVELKAYPNVLFLGETKNFSTMIEESSFKENSYPERNFISGGTLALLGEKYQKNESIENFVPHYLKLVEAEEKWKKAHPGAKDENYVEKL